MSQKLPGSSTLYDPVCGLFGSFFLMYQSMYFGLGIRIASWRGTRGVDDAGTRERETPMMLWKLELGFCYDAFLILVGPIYDFRCAISPLHMSVWLSFLLLPQR